MRTHRLFALLMTALVVMMFTVPTQGLVDSEEAANLIPPPPIP